MLIKVTFLTSDTIIYITKVVIIRYRFLKIMMGLLVLFLLIGAASAAEDNSTCLQSDGFDEIKDIIDNTPDNGEISLDEKEYCLDSDRTVKINKSLTFRGIENKTVIDGKGHCLSLDADEKEKPASNPGEIIIIWPDDGLKNTGKHIVFCNITFKNIRLETWHDMEFESCIFMNSTFESHELDNRFDGCIFDNSTVELEVVIGYDSTKIPRVSNGITGCIFTGSEIKTEAVYTPMYIHVVGGDFFRIYDSISITDTRFDKSRISAGTLNITIINAVFNSTDIEGHSNSIDIKNSEFYSQTIDWGICETRIENSSFNSTDMNLHASYFSIGSQTGLKNCTLNNAKIKVSPGFRSRKSQINITDCGLEDSVIDTTDTIINVKSSNLNRTELILFFSGLKISDSTLSNNGTLEDTIKTKLEDVKEETVDGKRRNVTVRYQVKTDYITVNTYFINETGKYEIKSEDISKNTLYSFSYVKQDIYYQNGMLTFVLKDEKGNPVCGEKIYVEIEDRYAYPTPTVTTDRNGIAKYRLNEIGNLKINAYYYSPGFNFDDICHEMTISMKVKSIVDDFKITKCGFDTNVYSAIGGYIKIKVKSKTSKDLSDIKFTIKIKNKKYHVKTDPAGIAYFDLPSKLKAGTYKAQIKVTYTKTSKTVKFKIKKAKTKVKAPKVTNKLKKSKYFKVTVKNMANKKAVSKTKVKIKVYTGKKHRTYTVKTDKKGTAKINTKNLKTGKHDVVITSGNKNYIISAKSRITIEK
jgi:hypothetical protein